MIIKISAALIYLSYLCYICWYFVHRSKSIYFETKLGTNLQLTFQNLKPIILKLLTFFVISDKRAVYLGCFIHAALYMPVRVGGEDGVQYVTTQVEAVSVDMFIVNILNWKLHYGR